MARTAVMPIPVGEASLRKLRAAIGLAERGWTWIQARKTARVSSRRLRVVETVSLGEKRFVAVVQVDGVSLLVGGSAAGVCLLKELRERDEGGRTSLDAAPLAKARRTRHPVQMAQPESFSGVLKAEAKKPRAKKKVDA